RLEFVLFEVGEPQAGAQDRFVGKALDEVAEYPDRVVVFFELEEQQGAEVQSAAVGRPRGEALVDLGFGFDQVAVVQSAAAALEMQLILFFGREIEVGQDSLLVRHVRSAMNVIGIVSGSFPRATLLYEHTLWSL